MEALTLFQVLFNDLQAHEYIEISVHQPGDSSPPLIPNGKQFFKSPQEAAEFASRFDQGYNVWFGVEPRRSRAGTVEAVSRLTTLFIDLDIEVPDGLVKIQDFLLKPTAVVHSGQHLQVYYRLADAIEPELFKSLIEQVAAWFGVDALKNINRVFRVPGTEHVKDPQHPHLCTMALPGGGVNQFAVYPATDLFAACHVKGKYRRAALTDKVPSEYKSPDGTPDRSRRDFAIIKHFQGLGISDNTIRLIARDLPFGERYREREDLLDYDLKAVSANSTLKKQSEDGSDGFIAEIDGFYYGGKRVSTFTIEPKSVVESTDNGDVLLCTVKANNRVWNNVPFPRRCFIGVREFLSQLTSTSWQWLGNPQQFKFLLPYLDSIINERELPRLQAVDYTGLHGSYFLSANQTIGTEGFIEQSPYVLMQRDSAILRSNWQSPDNNDFYQELFDNLSQMNKSHVIWACVGWYLAAPFKNVLFDQMNAKFPILNVFGEKGSGKTSTIIEVCQRLLGINDPENSCSTTDFNMLRMLSSSNSFPVVLDEHRAANAVGPRFFEYLRTAYTQGHEGRGRIDGTIKRYHLTCPIVLVGEDAIQDEATQERSVRVNFSKKWLENSPQAQDAFDRCRSLSVEQFSTPYLQFVLSSIVKSDYEKDWHQAESTVKQALSQLKVPLRIKDNLIMVAFGLLRGKSHLSSFPDVDITGTVVEIVDSMLNRGGEVDSLADAFISDIVYAYFDYANGGRRPEFTCKFVEPDNSFHFHGSSATRWWLKKRVAEGLPRLSPQSVLNQLSERSYLIGKKNHSISGSTMLMYGINMNRLATFGIDVPNPLPEIAEYSILAR